MAASFGTDYCFCFIRVIKIYQYMICEIHPNTVTDPLNIVVLLKKDEVNVILSGGCRTRIVFGPIVHNDLSVSGSKPEFILLNIHKEVCTGVQQCNDDDGICEYPGSHSLILIMI